MPATDATKKDGDVVIITRRVKIVPPDMRTVSTIDKVAGKNPPLYNLKDHPEFSGMNVVFMDMKINRGDTGEYMIAPAYVFADGKSPKDVDPIYICTG